MIERIDPLTVVVPVNRFRDAEDKDINDMVVSFQAHGQLQPIAVNSRNELIWGLHRLLAARKLNWNWIDTIRKESVTELEHREMELEENVRRKDMSPAEFAAAVAAIHKLKTAINPNWTLTETAIVAKLPRGKVDSGEMVRLAKMVELFPELAQAKSVNQLRSWAEAKASNVTRIIEVRESPEVYADIQAKVLLGDSVELVKLVPDNSFRAIITDPPFGIAYDERTSDTQGSLTSYEDDTLAYERLLSMAPELYRVLKPDGWLVWFFGISWYERCKQSFRDAGFLVDEIPIVWDRSEGRVFSNRPDRYFGRAYDLALHCLKGNPQIVGKRNLPNVLHIPPVASADRDALVERPVELYAELIRRLTIPGETVADFFVGSGSCLAAAASLGRDYFGCELDPERHAIALKKIKAYTGEAK